MKEVQQLRKILRRASNRTVNVITKQLSVKKDWKLLWQLCDLKKSEDIFNLKEYLALSKMNFGPQVDIPVGLNEASNANQNQAWQGLTIKEILEKVDLSNIIMDEDKKKVSVIVNHNSLCQKF